MKIKFDDKSFIEIKRTSEDGKDTVVVMIGARDFDHPSKVTIHTVELTQDQFKDLVSETG